MYSEVTHLEDAAARIPCMGAKKIGTILRQAAAEVPAGSCIVEVGAWLGAGTAQLAMGAMASPSGPEVHVFDRFTASASEVGKAAAADITLVEGQDTRPVVGKHLSAFDASVHLHRGDIRDIEWTHGSIGLYVDDASKEMKEFSHVLKTFGPSWVPGQTILIMMDFGYWRKFAHDPAAEKRLRAQYDFITAHPDCFEMVDERPVKGSSAAIIRYTKAFDFNASIAS